MATVLTSTEFLRRCLRSRVDPSAASALPESARELGDDWESLRAAIKRERLGPFLHETLGTMDVLPKALRRALTRSHESARARNAALLRALATALAALEAAAVPVIVLKGAALLETVYRGQSVRYMWDVDILVHRRDLDAVGDVLRGLGYAGARQEPRRGALAEHETEILFQQTDVPARIDVHWGLFDSPFHASRLEVDWLWDTAEPASIAGSPATILGPEAQLLHLCGHLALHHSGERLLWWHDIAEMLVFHRERLSWPEVLGRAGRYGLLLPLREILPRVAEGWGVPVPSGVLQELQHYEPAPDEEEVFGQYWERKRAAGLQAWHDLRRMPTWRQRRRYALVNLFPSADYMQRRYGVRHRYLVLFFYPYRWFRGVLGLRSARTPGPLE